MADGVARSPSRLCSRDGKICCYGDALSTIFLLACSCAMLPTFLFSFLYFLIFFLHPSIWAVLSMQASISCQRSNGGSDSHGHDTVTVDSSGN